MFGIIVPICYLGEDAQDMIVFKLKQDIHLTDADGVQIHRKTYLQLQQKVEEGEQKEQGEQKVKVGGLEKKDIVHHINANEFDNRVENLIKISA